MSAAQSYQVVFPNWYDERGEWEAKEKGWLQGVEVRFTDGDVQSLFFYDPVRLAQDLESETAQGRPLLSISGLVVIPEVTRDAILKAVKTLADTGHLKIQHHTSVA
jgi:hypothetical protein